MKYLARPALLISVLAVFLGTGCKEKELERRCSEQQDVIQNLQSENARLKQEADGLRSQIAVVQNEKKDIEQDRAALEKRLRGSGVSVGVREGRLAVILPSKVFFQSGKALLSRKGYDALRKVAKVVKDQFPDKVIRVEGHTDNQPIRKSGYKSNLELSNHRAETVWHFLTEKAGIDPRKVYTAGFSEFRPVASNNSASGRQQNRRVELVVIQE